MLNYKNLNSISIVFSNFFIPLYTVFVLKTNIAFILYLYIWEYFLITHIAYFTDRQIDKSQHNRWLKMYIARHVFLLLLGGATFLIFQSLGLSLKLDSQAFISIALLGLFSSIIIVGTNLYLYYVANEINLDKYVHEDKIRGLMFFFLGAFFAVKVLNANDQGNITPELYFIFALILKLSLDLASLKEPKNSLMGRSVRPNVHKF